MVQLIEKRNTHYLPLFVLGSVGLQVMILLVLFMQAGALTRLSRQDAPTLVQMQDGRAIRVAAMGAQERSPETIRRFVNDTLVLMFNWSGELPVSGDNAGQPMADPGLPIIYVPINNTHKKKLKLHSLKQKACYGRDIVVSSILYLPK